MGFGPLGPACCDDETGDVYLCLCGDNMLVELDPGEEKLFVPGVRTSGLPNHPECCAVCPDGSGDMGGVVAWVRRGPEGPLEHDYSVELEACKGIPTQCCGFGRDDIWIPRSMTMLSDGGGANPWFTGEVVGHINYKGQRQYPSGRYAHTWEMITIANTGRGWMVPQLLAYCTAGQAVCDFSVPCNERPVDCWQGSVSNARLEWTWWCEHPGDPEERGHQLCAYDLGCDGRLMRCMGALIGVTGGSMCAVGYPDGFFRPCYLITAEDYYCGANTRYWCMKIVKGTL